MKKIIDPKDIENIKPMKTVSSYGEAEYIEKKSRFIGHAMPVFSEQEALDFVASVKKEHKDATHNVYAYYVNKGIYSRYSDDGEPQGTSGPPTLDVIRKSGIDNVAVVTTRYFGGTLLGAGGLVRAYSQAAKLAIESAKIITLMVFRELEIVCDYSDYQKIIYELDFYDIITDGTEFTDKVTMNFAINNEQYDKFEGKIKELFAGRVNVLTKGYRYDGAR